MYPFFENLKTHIAIMRNDRVDHKKITEQFFIPLKVTKISTYIACLILLKYWSPFFKSVVYLLTQTFLGCELSWWDIISVGQEAIFILKGFLKRIEFEKRNNEFKILSSKAPPSLLVRSFGFKRANALPLDSATYI